MAELHFRSWLLRWSIASAVLLAVLFALVGRADQPRVVAFAGVCLGLILVGVLQLNPELVRERLRRNQTTTDPGRLAAIRLLVLIHVVVTLLDVGRFHWSDTVPMGLSMVALGVFVVGVLWIIWSMSVNPFFVPTIRLQPERGHRVIDEGPYKVVRHPGYLGMFWISPASALALGSWWGLVPALLASLLFVWRAADEDRFLLDQLQGYGTYASRVRFRLVPGMW